MPTTLNPHLRMTTHRHTRDAAVAAVLSKLSNLAMLPEIAARVLRLAEDPDVTMGRMAEVISTAPELSARILRIVNSAFYGFPGEVRSIERAAVLMGLESIKNVTIAASLTRAFQGRPLSRSFSPRDLWTHSLAVAAATRLVALEIDRRLAEEAFLAGLLHDIGLMAELQYDRQKVGVVLARMEADPAADLLRLEEQTFGATHQDFGAALLRGWNLPSSFCQVAEGHHRPLTLPAEHQTLPLMVHVADRLVAGCQPPFMLDEHSTQIADTILDQLRLTREQLAAIAEAIPAAVQELTAALGG